jgi:hypothetical protein
MGGRHGGLVVAGDMTARGGARASRRELGLPPRGLFPAATFFDGLIQGQASGGKLPHLARCPLEPAVPWGTQGARRNSGRVPELRAQAEIARRGRAHLVRLTCLPPVPAGIVELPRMVAIRFGLAAIPGTSTTIRTTTSSSRACRAESQGARRMPSSASSASIATRVAAAPRRM